MMLTYLDGSYLGALKNNSSSSSCAGTTSLSLFFVALAQPHSCDDGAILQGLNGSVRKRQISTKKNSEICQSLSETRN